MANSAVGGPSNPQVSANRGAGGVVPWRRAGFPRSAISVSTTKTLTTGSQPVQETIEGTGYIYGVNMEVVALHPSNNAAAVAYNEDGPYNALDVVSFSDSNGESLNLGGYDLYLANKYCGFMPRVDDLGSADTNVFQKVTGAGATGGDFRFHVRIPVAINHRNFLGLLGNQDRAMKYQLRSDIGSSGNIYSVAPTAQPNITINRTYESVTVPNRVSPDGAQQQQIPSKFGVIHYTTRSINSAAPSGNTTVNHYLPRLGNTIRFLVLELRSNLLRATAEANLPTRLQFQLGDTPFNIETTQYRRRRMYQRYGFDAPSGILVYDFATDILPFVAGSEIGVDWLWTNGLANAQFQIAYPSGFGSTANSLTILTDDLLVPPGVDVYAPDAL